MRLVQFITFAVAAACLASCAPTRNQYEVAVTALEGSSRMQRAVYADCIKKDRSQAWKKNAGIVMNVPDNKAAATFCRRAVDGLSSRRITYADLSAVYSGEFTPNLIKVMQGR